MANPINSVANVGGSVLSDVSSPSEVQQSSPTNVKVDFNVDAAGFSPAENKGRQLGVHAGIELPVPQSISPATSVISKTEIDAMVQTLSIKENGVDLDIVALRQRLTSLAGLALTSPDDVELELAKISNDTKNIEYANQIKKIEQQRELNKQQIAENQKQMEESADAIKDAKKAGLFSKIFGWISAIASVVIGAVMIATGFGAVAGALMIAGGVTSIVSMAVQQAAEDGLISPETMAVLGPVMTAIVVVVAVASIAVSFGGLALAGLGKLVAKLGAKGAEVGAKLAAKAAEFSAKVSNAVTSGARYAKLALDITYITSTVAAGVSATTSAAYQSKSLSEQADAQSSRSQLDQANKQMEIITEELKRLFAFFDLMAKALFGIQRDNDDMLQKLSIRPVI